MIVPDPPAVQWCRGLAGLLVDAAVQVHRLAGRIAEDWPDDHGREWAQRAELLHRELGRDADIAAGLGSILDRQDAEGAVLPPPLPGGRAPSGRGVRLGGTEASRIDDERGMRIAALPPAEDSAN